MKDKLGSKVITEEILKNNLLKLKSALVARVSKYRDQLIQDVNE